MIGEMPGVVLGGFALLTVFPVGLLSDGACLLSTARVNAEVWAKYRMWGME